MVNNEPSILHAIDTTGPGGAETVFLDLAQYLTLDGYNTIAVIKGPGWVEEQLKQRGVDYYIVKPKGGLSLNYYISLYRIIKKHNVKLIQAHLLGSTLTYSLLSLVLKIPLVATLHGRVDVNPNEKRIFIKNKIMQMGVSKLIAVSHDLAEYIAARGLFKKEKIAVIYNGVNVKKYQKNADASIRNTLGINNDAVLIGCVGNVRPAKAYNVLINAAKLVVEQNSNVHFIVAGHKKADLMVKLDDQIRSQDLAQHVHFVGFQEDTAHFLGQMDLFALSSSSEGFSIATIEAMASELPVVVTRCGGPEEIVTHDETGYLVKVNDAFELSEALLKLISNESLRVQFAQAAKKHVISTFSMDKLLEEYRKIFTSLIKTT
ncbi:glycosyl transferase [Cellvibrio zantedeschiae]|uniref:Glycosyl transferase n=1 Tax=Cellvibrio zantedeschiae TaxID=1237077 RepID=A0ABQ3B7I3_9GAMM|nr:glycosyltransferase family 4 protein [Cellvibrio zantedeschiae]GGY82293.1 glycosyl transferase [Cellvibrio zantedeschiae]